MRLTSEQQCVANIRAVLYKIGLPVFTDAEIIDRRQDRVFVQHSKPFLFALVHAKARSIDPTGERIVRRFRRDWSVARHHPGAVRGWREWETCCALQVCEHPDAIELDLDYGGAFTDAVGFVVHAWEVLGNWLRRRKTDPYKMAAALRKYRGIHSDG